MDSVVVRWRGIRSESDELWRANRGLYAYLLQREIVYLGKMDGCTVRSRFTARDKDSLFDWMDDSGLGRGVKVIVGEFRMAGRLTRQLHADIESLLIIAIQPRGNISATRTRITRPGLRVECEGTSWPLRTRRFLDGG